VQTVNNKKPPCSPARDRHQDTILERRLPYDLESEQAVLGCMILGPDCCDDVAIRLTAADFFDTAHQPIYDCMIAMHNAGRKIDPKLLIEGLKKTGQYETVGGAAYIAKISQSVPNAAHAVYYAELVADNARRRDLVAAGTEIVRDGFDDMLESDESVTRAEQRIFGLRERKTTREPQQAKTVIHKCLDDLDRRLRGEQTSTVVATGFRELDATLAGGLHDGELVIVAARPSMGKSAFATDIARHAAGQDGKTVFLVNLEMSFDQLGDRLLIAQSGIDGHRMRNGTLSNEDRVRLVEAAGEISSWPLYIEDDASLRPTTVASLARRLARKAKAPIGLLIVDYLQLLDPEQTNSRDQNRQQEVAFASRFLKKLAKELACPVLAVAQLNRKTEDAGDRRPRMSHLRESGAIEQDADVVLFVHREEYYLRGEEAREAEGKAEIIVAKQRNGPPGTIELRWDKRSMRFQNLAPSRIEEHSNYEPAFSRDTEDQSEF
jgi:replicative DNA helicase